VTPEHARGIATDNGGYQAVSALHFYELPTNSPSGFRVEDQSGVPTAASIRVGYEVEGYRRWDLIHFPVLKEHKLLIL
jgi:hypothetical protein